MREDLSRTRVVARRKNCEDVMAATRGQETVAHTRHVGSVDSEQIWDIP